MVLLLPHLTLILVVKNFVIPLLECHPWDTFHKEYADRLRGIINKVRLLGFKFYDSRIIQKILVTIPEKFETTISSLENAKDLSKISLAELLNAL